MTRKKYMKGSELRAWTVGYAMELALGGELRRWRRMAGVSQERMAGRLGVTRSHVSMMERGELGMNWGYFLEYLDMVNSKLGVIEK